MPFEPVTAAERSLSTARRAARHALGALFVALLIATPANDQRLDDPVLADRRRKLLKRRLIEMRPWLAWVLPDRRDCYLAHTALRFGREQGVKATP